MSSMDPRLIVPSTDPVPVVPPVIVPASGETNDHWLPSNVYDIIKFVAQILLPAVATLYFALSGIWGLPRPEDVVGTIVAVDAFLGVFLSINKSQFLKTDSPYDGTIDVASPIDGPKTFTLIYNGDPNDLDNQKQAVFKIES